MGCIMTIHDYAMCPCSEPLCKKCDSYLNGLREKRKKYENCPCHADCIYCDACKEFEKKVKTGSY